MSFDFNSAQDTNKQQKEFMFLFGLEGSLDESSIFEEDYQIEAMSTVKGLRLINQGQIPGVAVKKITMANISDIDTLQISDNLKTKYRDSVRQGNTIYTPTKQYTYQNWTGLVYISVNPNTGFGSYIIGEGLNGGYTVAQWLANWLYFWKTGLITNAQAIINLPKTVYTLGEKLIYSIFYKFFLSNGQVVEIEEPAEKDTRDMGVGTQPIKPNYDVPGEEKQTEVKYGRRLGNERNQHDPIIFQEAEEFGIDPDLLKSLVHQESLNFDTKLFHKEAYRYEPCIDYNWFSGNSPTIGLIGEPYNHYTIPGYDLSGNPVPQGDKLPSTYKQKVKQGALASKWNLRFDDSDPNLTLTKLWDNNDAIQHWSKFCGLSPEQRNFTVQFLVTGSYGLTQILYQTAVERDFNKDKPNRSPYELFEPEIGIHYGAKHLRYCYDREGQNWYEALGCYNPDPAYQKKVYNDLYLSPLYDFIEE